MLDFLLPIWNEKSVIHDSEIINFQLHLNSEWNAFISISENLIKETVKYILSWSRTPDALSCKRSSNFIKSYPVGQSSFTEKVMIYEIKELFSK